MYYSWLQQCILAVFALDERGYYCTFGGRKVIITNNGEVYAQGRCRNHLYPIEFELNKEYMRKMKACLAKTSIIYPICNNEQLRFWRQRQGHIYYKWILKMVKLGIIVDLKLSQSDLKLEQIVDNYPSNEMFRELSHVI